MVAVQEQTAWASCLAEAEEMVKVHMAKYDPSHDWQHVARVRKTAMALAKSEPEREADLKVVEMAALFHDLLDTKYLPKDAPTPTAFDFLAPFFSRHSAALTSDQCQLIGKVVDNIGFKKEIKRKAQGLNTEWHSTCFELHCVSDADRLDAVGAFGILRCSAYSAVVNRALYKPVEERKDGEGSAMEHFDEKLFSLKDMMKTKKGREAAERRDEVMRRFVEEVEREAAAEL